ncbi:hypothetical protein [Kitasatospora sp. NPDC088346]|uniref:hypothetical protein n=1 Tax=Kitasatospora sp. NPDC088346 TaxID=3364073 RepID=UPI0038293121
MVGCSRLATNLDLEMLEWAASMGNVADAALPKKSGLDVYEEIGHRHLLRFVMAEQIGAFKDGSIQKHFTTPTPYPPDEIVDILHLPAVHRPRLWALVLDPREIPNIYGPRLVRWGHAIEYLLPDGFPEEALVSRWEVQVS